jgi:hypothetical protein
MVEFAYISPIGSQWNLRLTDYFVATTDGTSMQLQFCDEAPTLTKPDGTPVTLGASHLHAGTAAAIGTLPLVLTPATPFSVPQTPWLWGVHAEMLANPATDPLPTSPTDPAVWDQDNDGQPGVTEDISNPDGHQYQAHRDVWTLGAGNATDPNWLTGPLTFSVEQVVLDADNAQLKIATPINVLSKCQSVYQMRCVDESITCETLLANASTLFKGAPK